MQRFNDSVYDCIFWKKSLPYQILLYTGMTRECGNVVDPDVVPFFSDSEFPRLQQNPKHLAPVYIYLSLQALNLWQLGPYISTKCIFQICGYMVKFAYF